MRDWKPPTSGDMAAGPTPSGQGRQRILAVASRDENWWELELLAHLLWPGGVVFAAPLRAHENAATAGETVHLEEFTLYRPRGLVSCFRTLAMLLRRRDFDLIVTTGAAHGLLAVFVGRLRGVRSVWIESSVSTQRLSLSGRLAGFLVDHWFVQWPELARPGGPYYAGAIV